MKNIYLLIWTEKKNNRTERHHAWYRNYLDAIHEYKVALELCTDVIVFKIVADNIDRITMLEDGSPF